MIEDQNIGPLYIDDIENRGKVRELKDAWSDAQRQLEDATKALEHAMRNCQQAMEIIASEIWSVNHGDLVMFLSNKQWKKAKVHCVMAQHNWFNSMDFHQFRNRPWLALHPINKDGTFSKAVVNGYPNAWLTLKEFDKQVAT